MSSYKEKFVICPYFKRFYQDNAIKCESSVKGFDVILQKANKRQIDAYAHKYCYSFNYRNCPYAIKREREEENQ